MIYCPLTTSQEQAGMVAVTKTGVAVTGAAAMGTVGPDIGGVDIGESDNSYFFRVSLPGVARDQNSFSCDIGPDGKVKIKGETTTRENIVCKRSQVFRMRTRNLCPPGHFSITFQLPGPVNHLQFSGSFPADGIKMINKLEQKGGFFVNLLQIIAGSSWHLVVKEVMLRV